LSATMGELTEATDFSTTVCTSGHFARVHAPRMRSFKLFFKAVSSCESKESTPTADWNRLLNVL